MSPYMFNIIIRKSLSVALNLLALGVVFVGGTTTVVGVYTGVMALRYFGVGLLALFVLMTLLRLLSKAARNSSG